MRPGCRSELDQAPFGMDNAMKMSFLARSLPTQLDHPIRLWLDFDVPDSEADDRIGLGANLIFMGWHRPLLAKNER
jgi:hypothetical protein